MEPLDARTEPEAPEDAPVKPLDIPCGDLQGTVVAALPVVAENLDLAWQAFRHLRPGQEGVAMLVVMVKRLLLRLARLAEEGDDLFTAHCVGRAAFESSLNLCYVVVAGKPAYDQMERHLRQKRARDHSRRLRAGPVTVTMTSSAYPELLKDPETQEALREFTTRAGREARAWTDLSVEERMDAVLRGQPVAMALDVLDAFRRSYRVGSEVLHGTMYGAARGWGLDDFDDPSGDSGAARREGIVALAWALAQMGCRVVTRIVSALESTEVRLHGPAENMRTLLAAMDGSMRVHDEARDAAAAGAAGRNL